MIWIRFKEFFVGVADSTSEFLHKIETMILMFVAMHFGRIPYIELHSEVNVGRPKRNIVHKNRGLVKTEIQNIADALLLIGLDYDNEQEMKPYTKFKFPATFTVPEGLQDFCYPDLDSWPPPKYVHNYYTVILTNENGDRRFGYCKRLQPEGESACIPLTYCIVTPNKSASFYNKILNEIESIHGQSDFTFLLEELYSLKFPKNGESITWNGIRIKQAEDMEQENSELVGMMKAITPPLFLQAYSSLLYERHVIITGSNISKISDCIIGMQRSLFPFEWHHTLITCLPNELLDVVQAPAPYLIGVLSFHLDFLPLSIYDEVLILDIDRKSILQKVGNENTILPKKYSKHLIKDLEQSMNTSEPHLNILMALSRLFDNLFGHFRDHIAKDDFSTQFETDTFISNARNDTKLFLNRFSETAMFQMFIDKHLGETEESRS